MACVAARISAWASLYVSFVCLSSWLGFGFGFGFGSGLGLGLGLGLGHPNPNPNPNPKPNPNPNPNPNQLSGGVPCDGTASAWSWHAGRALLPFVFRLRLRERSPETHAGGEAACGDAPLAHLAHLARLAQPGTPRPLGTSR